MTGSQFSARLDAFTTHAKQPLSCARERAEIYRPVVPRPTVSFLLNLGDVVSQTHKFIQAHSARSRNACSLIRGGVGLFIKYQSPVAPRFPFNESRARAETSFHDAALFTVASRARARGAGGRGSSTARVSHSPRVFTCDTAASHGVYLSVHYSTSLARTMLLMEIYMTALGRNSGRATPERNTDTT